MNSYNVLLGAKARQTLESLPDYLLSQARDELAKLASDPKTFGRRAPSPPYRRAEQVFFFKLRDANGVLHHLTAFFFYTEDEKSIVVSTITAIPPFAS